MRETWGPDVYGPDDDGTAGFYSMPTLTSTTGIGSITSGSSSIGVAGGGSTGTIGLSSLSISGSSPWLIGTSRSDALVRDDDGQVLGWRFHVDTTDDGEFDMLVPLTRLPKGAS